MTTGRKPTPTALKVVKGNPGKRSLPKHEPKFPPAIPQAPDWLSPEAREEWGRVAETLYRAGLLTMADRGALAAYCEAWGVFSQASRVLRDLDRQNPATRGLLARTTNGNAIQNPLLGVANKAREDMMRFAAEFGMTPAARARVAAVAPADPDKEAHDAHRFFG